MEFKQKYLTKTEIKDILKDFDTFTKWYDQEDGGEGAVLDLITSIRNLDGEDATDRECLFMISDVTLMWNITRS